MNYLLAIFAYLLILTGIAVYKSRQVKNQADFSVAGRTLSPWIMVCTMLAVWIGTGSIVGNAGQAYRDGMVTLILPLGTFIGMILLAQIATKARNYEVYSVPEIIGSRYGAGARLLSVIALVMAYMVIVSYQFNAGGMVLEVIAGKHDPISVKVGDVVTQRQIAKRYLEFHPKADWRGSTSVSFDRVSKDPSTGEMLPIIQEGRTVRIDVVSPSEIIKKQEELDEQEAVNHIAIKDNNVAKVKIDEASGGGKPGRNWMWRVESLPENGSLVLSTPKLTSRNATIIAAIFIIAYTMLAGLLSLAFTDIVTGSIITLSMFIAFPVLLIKAGGFSGMATAFAAMGDKPHHMQFWGVYGVPKIINYCLPVFLLILGDANQYQRIFASRNAKGAKTAVTVMIFLALAIELLIIACAWIAGSMIPDPENGRYVLIYAAKHIMPLPLGMLFMITVVGIIISTADSFLLVPATTFIKDIYLVYINPKAKEKRIVFLSRMMVLMFGIVAFLVTRAFPEGTTVFQKALYAFTIYGTAITPCLAAAFFWSRATKQGAIASILTGTIVTLAWSEDFFIKYFVSETRMTKITEFAVAKFPEWIRELDAVLPAITLSALALVIVSLMTPRKITATKE